MDKIGSGLLFTSGQEVLLLLRNSKHNDKTWGLPGGNQERGDLTLFDTAQREAREEMGELPSNFRVSREQKVTCMYSSLTIDIHSFQRRESTSSRIIFHHGFQERIVCTNIFPFGAQVIITFVL